MTPDECECDFDPAYHRALNERLGKGTDDAQCHNQPDDYDTVVASPALCTSCLFGCAS